MSRARGRRNAPPSGFEVIEPKLMEFESKMRDAESESHEGKRKVESVWPIFRIHHQRSRYVWEAYQKHKIISREVYDYAVKQGYADANLISKWKKEGYERLCCLRCIQTKDTNYGTTCICRVPRAALEDGKIVECNHCGCRGCASGDGKSTMIASAANVSKHHSASLNQVKSHQSNTEKPAYMPQGAFSLPPVPGMPIFPGMNFPSGSAPMPSMPGFPAMPVPFPMPGFPPFPGMPPMPGFPFPSSQPSVQQADQSKSEVDPNADNRDTETIEASAEEIGTSDVQTSEEKADDAEEKNTGATVNGISESA